jgi:hypothetical protein
MFYILQSKCFRKLCPFFPSWLFYWFKVLSSSSKPSPQKNKRVDTEIMCYGYIRNVWERILRKETILIPLRRKDELFLNYLHWQKFGHTLNKSKFRTIKSNVLISNQNSTSTLVEIKTSLWKYRKLFLDGCSFYPPDFYH